MFHWGRLCGKATIDISLYTSLLTGLPSYSSLWSLGRHCLTVWSRHPQKRGYSGKEPKPSDGPLLKTAAPQCHHQPFNILPLYSINLLHSARKINHKIRKRKLGGAFPVITEEQVATAIKASKTSKAEGPDGLTILYLKHLGPHAIKYLTALYNLSVRNVEVPAVWKQAIIIPLVKPSKPADTSTSYRPISLLSPCIKVLEKILLPHIDSVLPKADH